MLKRIKNFLKRFLPMPVRAFQREMDQANRKISMLNQRITELEKTVKRQAGIIKREMPDRLVTWNSEFERTYVRENWGNVTEDADFAEKFLRLTAGMDWKSIEAVTRILVRQKRYLSTNKTGLNLFTREEQEQLRLLKENFRDEILKLSDDLYCYRGYFLPVKHFEASVFYYKHGISELSNPGFVAGKVIVDVGGFIGDSLPVLAEMNPSEIYTFEADPENFRLLQKTVELNHLNNVTAENVALGARSGTAAFHVRGSMSSTVEQGGVDYRNEIEVPVVAFDDYAAKHPMNIGLIKVDIEGAEPEFLAGAKKTICEQRPIILLSIYHNAHDFFELKPLIESWDLGYSFRIHKPTFGNATSETLLIAEPPDDGQSA